MYGLRFQCFCSTRFPIHVASWPASLFRCQARGLKDFCDAFGKGYLLRKDYPFGKGNPEHLLTCFLRPFICISTFVIACCLVALQFVISNCFMSFISRDFTRTRFLCVSVFVDFFQFTNVDAYVVACVSLCSDW